MHPNSIKINDEFDQFDADQIKQIIKSLMPDHSEKADPVMRLATWIVIDAAIEALQKKIDEKELVEFLNLFA